MTNQGYAPVKSLTPEDDSTPREQQMPSTPPAFQCAAGGRAVPSSDPATICACLSHRKFWRSIYGPHLICATCHRPASESAVAEWIDVGDRSETMIAALSTARARMRARLALFDDGESKTNDRKKPHTRRAKPRSKRRGKR